MASDAPTIPPDVGTDILDAYGRPDADGPDRDAGETIKAKRDAVNRWIQSILDRFTDPDLDYREIVKLFDAHSEAYVGVTFPPLLEKKALDLALAAYPDRDDLRARLEQVEKSLVAPMRYASCRFLAAGSPPDDAVPRVAPSRKGLPPDILSALEQHGGRAFIVARVQHAGADRIIICPDQNRCGAFAEGLSEMSRDIGGCLFLDALRHALLGDVYEAAFAFFDWIHQPGGPNALEFLLFDAGDKPLPGYCGSPIYGYNQPTALPAETTNRSAMLMAMFNACEGTIGNDAVRDWLMAALAFALSRHCGLTGEYEIGSNFVDRALAFGHRPNGHQYIRLHLEACRHVLDLKQRGLEVHPRLEKFAGRDNGYLNEVVCHLPFTNMQINPLGQVHICCPEIVPDNIGNIVSDDVEEIINSEMVTKIRRSVMDGSFKYCDHVNCPLLVRGTLPRKDSAEIKSDSVLRIAIDEDKCEVESVRTLSFGYDFSCNLSCPSCRTEVMVQKFSETGQARKAIDEKLAPLLPSLQRLFINSTGEFLVSKPSRLLLQAIDPLLCSKLQIDLLSNGTLFSEAEWQKFSNIHGLVTSIRISTDAASPATFEKVRRGAKWDIFWENINFLGGLRRDNRIGELGLNFTYQLANFREMKNFVQMCEDIGADRAVFQRLFPTAAMTDAEYHERAVHKTDHPLHLEFLEIIGDPCFKQPNVVGDFEF